MKFLIILFKGTSFIGFNNNLYNKQSSHKLIINKN